MRNPDTNSSNNPDEGGFDDVTPSSSRVSTQSEGLKHNNGSKKQWVRKCSTPLSDVDSAILKLVDAITKTLHEPAAPKRDDSDEDELFCLSLVPGIKRLPPREKSLAKMQMQSAL